MKPLRLIPDDTNLPFMKWARIRTPISLVLIALSLVLFFTVGVNSGIDFKGGTVIEIRSHQAPADMSSIRDKLNSLGLGEVQIQGIGDESTVLIRIATQQIGVGNQIDLERSFLGSPLFGEDVGYPPVSREIIGRSLDSIVGFF